MPTTTIAYRRLNYFKDHYQLVVKAHFLGTRSGTEGLRYI